jgi:hypothetical protein
VGQKFRDEAGNIWEMDASGQPRLVSGGQSPAMGPAIGNDPRIPGSVRAQNLQAERTQQEIQNNPLNVANARTNIQQGQNSIRQSQIGNVQELRKEFNALPEVKNYSEYLTQMSKAIRAPDSPQGDLSVIYAFAKAMDPGSVVREGEMDMANSTSSTIQDIYRRYGKIQQGNRLPPEVRHGLVESIRSAGHGFADSYALKYRQYRDNAQTLGADPKQVVGNHLGDAFRGLEQSYVAKFGKSENGPPPISLDANGNAILQDRGGGSVQGSDTGLIGEKGGSHTQNFPGLEGANVAVNAMLKAGRPVEQITAYLKSRGAPEESIAGIVPQAEAIKQWQANNPGYQGDFNIDVERQQVPNSGFQNFANSDIGSGTLLGTNAALGGLPGAMAGAQPLLDAARGAHPASTFTGELAGAVGGTLGLSKVLSFLPSKYLAANPAKRLLAADLGYGGTYGATQNPDNPFMGATLGSGAALLGNVIGSKVVAPALRGIGGKLGYGTPALPAGEGMIANQAIKANPEDVLGRLNDAAELNMPFTLSDADPRLRSLAGSAVRKSPDAYALANERLGSRTLGQVDRLTGIVEGETGPRLNLPTFKEGVKKTAQAQSRPLYESAKAQAPVDDPQISEMLQTPAGQRAARSGYDEAINNGEPVGDLVEQVDSITGQVRLAGRPSWHVLQRMKFALDAMPEQEGLARRFNSRLGTLNTDFKKANLTYAKEIRRGDIAQSGYDLANPNIKGPELSAGMAAPRNMKDPALFRQGYGSNLVDKARGMRDSANPYEMASMASPDQLAKMQAISPELHGKFGRARGIEGEMSLTNRELFGGSATQPRAEADKMFDAGGIMDFAQDAAALAAGTPPINVMKSKLFAGRGLFRTMDERLKFGSANTAKQRADQMAPNLFNPNSEEAAAALAEMIRQQELRNAYVQRTGMFGSAVAAPVAIGLSNR